MTPHTERDIRSPTLLVFADTDAGARAATQAAEASGARVAAVLDVETPRARLDEQAALDGVCVELSRHPGPAGEGLLGWLGEVTAQRDVVATVACPIELVDYVDARAGHSAAILVSPDDAERVVALSFGWTARPGMHVADVAREIDSVRLRRLADEVSRIARSLSSLSSQGAPPPGGYASALQAQLADVQTGLSAERSNLVAPPMPTSHEVRKLIRMRRLRDSFFDPALFADPAWDMLLDLFAARIDGDQVAVSSLCIAAAVPPTTALRWIKTMTDHGIFERHADPNDRRRIFIRLAEAPTRAMAEYFQAVRRFEGVAI